jgi:dephospho-CoA kinase
MSFKVGLTGGVASGKSTVCKLFSDLGIEIIDADLIARNLLARDTRYYREVITAFGDEVKQANGELDRRYLRGLIFNDAQAKQRLENILHPAIKAKMLTDAGNCRSLYCILVIPLLFEVGMQDLVNRTVVVDIPEDLQQMRLCQRDDLTVEQARAMINSQYPRQQRLQLADDIIDNSGEISQLGTQVTRLHHLYLELAGN